MRLDGRGARLKSAGPVLGLCPNCPVSVQTSLGAALGSASVTPILLPRYWRNLILVNITPDDDIPFGDDGRLYTLARSATK